MKNKIDFMVDALQRISQARNSGSNDARYLADIASVALIACGYTAPKKHKRYQIEGGK